MPTLVADTSGLVSLGIAAGHDPDPLALCLDRYDVRVPTAVIKELESVAAYDDAHGAAAATVLDRETRLSTSSVDPKAEFPLDDGEHAAVTLANELEAELFLCDEFNRLGLIHASLATTRLVTTPTLLVLFNRTGLLTGTEAISLLDRIGSARSWESNSYVERARSLFEDS
jgi:predicted nucleic acid-binding protein